MCRRRIVPEPGRAAAILAEVIDVVGGWRRVADEVGIDGEIVEQIASSHRLTLLAPWSTQRGCTTSV